MNYKELLQKLRNRGITSIQIEYHGSGDSGDIFDPCCYGEEVSEEENEGLKDLVFAVLEREYPGWEINDGSEGTLKIDLSSETPRLDLQHGIFYTDKDEHEHAWELTDDTNL
ncbi:MAG: DUF6878 family protein [Halobacteria archaeon]